MRWFIRLIEFFNAYTFNIGQTRRFRELRQTLERIKERPYRSAREKSFASNKDLLTHQQELRRLRLKMEFENACGKYAKEFKTRKD